MGHRDAEPRRSNRDRGRDRSRRARRRWRRCSRSPPAAAYVLFAAILLVHGALNATSVRLVAWLNDASATVHIVGVVALAALLFTHRVARRSPYLAETGHTTRAGGSYALGFVQSLVLGVWTFTGFDAAAHVSEETHDPARRAPFGIVSSVAVSAVAGFALVAGLTLARGGPRRASRASPTRRSSCSRARSATARAASRWASPSWRCGSRASRASPAPRGCSSPSRATTASRARRSCAASRRPRRTPLHAIAVCVAAPFALVMATLPFSETVFLAVAALATVALYASYAVPIALGAAARLGEAMDAHGARSRWAAPASPVAVASVAWTAAVFAVCALANALAIGLFAGVVVGLAVLWALKVKGGFKGPKVDLSHFEGSGHPLPGKNV